MRAHLCLIAIKNWNQLTAPFQKRAPSHPLQFLGWNSQGGANEKRQRKTQNIKKKRAATLKEKKKKKKETFLFADGDDGTSQMNLTCCAADKLDQTHCPASKAAGLFFSCDNAPPHCLLPSPQWPVPGIVCCHVSFLPPFFPRRSSHLLPRPFSPKVGGESGGDLTAPPCCISAKDG